MFTFVERNPGWISSLKCGQGRRVVAMETTRMRHVIVAESSTTLD